MLEVGNWFLLFSIITVSFRHLDIALMYWRIFLEMKLEDMLDFIEKNTFFNSGLCPPFSEKRYICFLVNILAALLIIFIPNFIRKCQIMCSRMIRGNHVSMIKENRFLLVPIATVVKENFSQFISKYFL